MADSVVPTYSISIRLRRTTTEFAFVSVPVTSDIVVMQPDGTGRIDTDRMTRQAITLGYAPDLEWHPEELQVTPHPIQIPPPWLAQPGEPRADDETAP
jgi:hypothetical protein